MKIKFSFLILLSLFATICFSQLFNIFPYAEDIFTVYKSGYFKDLDRQAMIITDAFIEVKMMTKPGILKGSGSISSKKHFPPEYSWVLIDDLQKKYNLEIKVYDKNAQLCETPNVKKNNDNNIVIDMLNDSTPEITGFTKGNYYNVAVPVENEKKCQICHTKSEYSDLLGVITYKIPFDSKVFYSRERIIIFSLLLFADFVLIYFVLKWDPEKNIKELFDKTD